MFEPKLPQNSLLKKTKDKICINIFKETLNKLKEKCILIVDKRGSYFLNNYFTVSELINLGIISVESIYFIRKPYQNHEALYIISACKESINNMSDDFIETKEKPLYKSCHVFTLDELNEELMNLILTKKNLLKYIKTLKQIMIDYIPIDKNIFTFGNDRNFNSLFNLYDFEKDPITNEISISKLLTVCECLDNYPNIAYFSPDKNCKLIAEKVNSGLKKYYSKKKNIKRNGILLIVSRFLDFLAPIQFGLNYQHLLLELLKKRDDKYYNKVSIKDEKNKTEKEIILDYKKDIYNKYKNLPIYDAIKKCDEDFRNFTKSDVGKMHKINEDKNIDLALALKNVPKYHHYVESYSQQINLSSEIDKLAKKRNIMSLLDIQQKVISKINEKGKKIPEKDIIALIKDNKGLFSQSDLMRLLCLIKYSYPKINIEDLISNIESNNIKFKENDKNIINFFDKKKCLLNTDVIDQLEQSLVSYRTKNYNQTKEDLDNKNDKSYPYIKESKFTTLCDMCSKNELPKTFFSYVEKPENLPQKVKINLGLFGSKQEDDNDSNQNLILYCIGGLSNFEVASMEQGLEIGQWGLNLILGANKIYNYKEFFGEISDYLKGNNGIISVEEKIPKEIKNKKEKDKEERKKEEEKNKNKGKKVDINEKDNNGKHSKEKLNKKFDLNSSDDPYDNK